MKEKVININISMLAKCRALFVYNMAILNNKHLVLDDWFWMMLNSYMQDNIFNYYKELGLIFPIGVDDGGEVYIIELGEAQIDVIKLYREYLTIFIKEGMDTLELLDSIGDEKIAMIQNLAIDFNKYKKSMVYSRIKQ